LKVPSSFTSAFLSKSSSKMYLYKGILWLYIGHALSHINILHLNVFYRPSAELQTLRDSLFPLGYCDHKFYLNSSFSLHFFFPSNCARRSHLKALQVKKRWRNEKLRVNLGVSLEHDILSFLKIETNDVRFKPSKPYYWDMWCYWEHNGNNPPHPQHP
jgi:hypothetical protein